MALDSLLDAMGVCTRSPWERSKGLARPDPAPPGWCFGLTRTPIVDVADSACWSLPCEWPRCLWCFECRELDPLERRLRCLAGAAESVCAEPRCAELVASALGVRAARLSWSTNARAAPGLACITTLADHCAVATAHLTAAWQALAGGVWN